MLRRVMFRESPDCELVHGWFHGWGQGRDAHGVISCAIVEDHVGDVFLIPVPLVDFLNPIHEDLCGLSDDVLIALRDEFQKGGAG